MMGVWFLSISIGSYIAGLTTRLFEGNDTSVLTRGFGIFAGITLVAAVILAVLTPLIKRMTPQISMKNMTRLKASVARNCPLRVGLAILKGTKQTSNHRRHFRSGQKSQLQRLDAHTFAGSKMAITILLTNEAARRDVPRLQKVNAATGEAVPFFDAAKMQAAFAALPGVSAQDARQLANRGNYNLNPAETAVLINWSNDLFYYEFGSDRAIRLTSNPGRRSRGGFQSRRPHGQLRA